MPDCGVHYLWFAFVCFLIRSHPPPPSAWPCQRVFKRPRGLADIVEDACTRGPGSEAQSRIGSGGVPVPPPTGWDGLRDEP